MLVGVWDQAVGLRGSTPKMLVPLIGMLRPENIICSGFTLTLNNRLPAVAREYMSCAENNVPVSALQKRGRTRALPAAQKRGRTRA